MNIPRLSLILAVILYLLSAPGAIATERPNVLIILADDLGFSDIGCYGGEIRTPNLDRLAAGGLRYSGFYNTARCWPTRAALMTGYYPQQVGRDRIPGVKAGGAGNKRPPWARLMPQILKTAGYRCYHSGKWHIDGSPIQGGFDHSYWTPDHGRYFSPKRQLEDDKVLPPVPAGTDYYATTAIADHTIQYLKEHHQHHADKPFLSYVAFLAPHFPLHALPQDIAKYKDSYVAGWEVVRGRRWEKIQKLGLVDGQLSAVERNIGPPYHLPKQLEKLGPGEVNRPLIWNELTDQQRQFQATKMSIHAAMVDRMDIEIGRILAQLEQMQQLENTLIVFLSDNGASAEIMVRDDGHDPLAPPGSAATHLCLGPGWSTSCNTPFRRHKTWVHEGGIATPLVVHWPNGIRAKNEIRRNPAHVIDLMPTIFDLASVKHRVAAEVPELPGRSLVATFDRDNTVQHDAIWWLHEGNRAVRVADWKLVAARDQPWELYDLSVDRNETHDLAGQQPERVSQLQKIWETRLAEFKHQAMLNQKQVESKSP